MAVDTLAKLGLSDETGIHLVVAAVGLAVPHRVAGTAGEEGDTKRVASQQGVPVLEAGARIPDLA